MTSCSDSLDTDITTVEQGELTTYKFKTAIVLPQEMAEGLTRAEGDKEFNDNGTNKTHNDGVVEEYTIDNNKLYFALYNADGIALSRATVDNISSWTDESSALVTIGADVTLKALQKPKYLVVFANLTDEERTNLTGQNLENLLTGKANDGNYFRPGRNYLASSLGESGETFYQRPASFRNMMLSRYANLSDANFFMMNSSWNSDANNDDQGHHNIRAVDISNYVFEENDFIASTSPRAIVYIERVVAKVNTLFEVPATATTDAGKGYRVADVNGLPAVKINQKKGYNNGTYTENSQKKPYAPESYYVKFDGWQLNATNKSFKPLKDIGDTPGRFINIAGNNYKAFRDGRSYWAFDQNYEQDPDYYLINSDFTAGNNGWAYTKTPQLNYYTLTNMKRLKFGTADAQGKIKDYTDYCFENTMVGESQEHTGAVTHVLVRAQYIHEDGTTVGKDKNVYRVAKTIYEEEGLRHFIFDHLDAMYPNKLTIDDILLEHNNKDFHDHNDVKSKVKIKAGVLAQKFSEGIKYTGIDEHGNAVEKTVVDGDVTEIVFGQATVYTFERGVCYYSIPIKHFADGKKVGDEGYFGVVRNHWYQITINEVNSFGHPATPGEGPDPNDPDKPYDPENPGKPNDDGSSTDPTKPVPNNPNDPDNPSKPDSPDPTKPDYPGPDDPNTPGGHNPHDPNNPNPGKPIIPEDNEDDDFNLNARIKVLSWAKMSMKAQLGGMQNWH